MKSLDAVLRRYRNDRSGSRTSKEWLEWVLEVWLPMQPPLKFHDWFRLYAAMTKFNFRLVRGMGVTAQAPHEIVFAIMALLRLEMYYEQAEHGRRELAAEDWQELRGLIKHLLATPEASSKSNPKEHTALWRLLAKIPQAMDHFSVLVNWSERFR